MVNKSKNTRKLRSLVVKQLEKVSKDLFKQHYSLITELIGNSPGVYALYDETELYYVGKSVDLKKRVKQHLKDKHYASWTHFSLYLVRNSEHIHEIESLLVRIADPKGNKVVPKGKSSGPLMGKLKKMVKAKQAEEFVKMFGDKAKEKQNKDSKSLSGLVERRTPLFRMYKGKEYKAILNPSGKISYGNEIYPSATAAAKAASGKARGVNGWNFWYIKDENGNWVKLNQFFE